MSAIVDRDEAVVARRQGRPAGGLREAARSAFGRLGMVGWARDEAAAPVEVPVLTVREAEVLELLAAGRTNREIAATLVVAEPTVRRHVANIYRKVGTRNRAEATAYALRHPLHHPDHPVQMRASVDAGAPPHPPTQDRHILTQ